MTDIVERLRAAVVNGDPWAALALTEDAATEIERLRLSLAGAGHELEAADLEIERLKATAVRQAGIMHRFGDKPDATG